MDSMQSGYKRLRLREEKSPLLLPVRGFFKV